MEIKRVKLFPNHNEKSLTLAKLLEEKMRRYGYEVARNGEAFDMAIAIGGDGSYLRMVKNNRFNSDIYYVGVNMGTLGFLQEVSPDEVDYFLNGLNHGLYQSANVGIQETNVNMGSKTLDVYSLNDIVIRKNDLKKANFDVYIDDELLEHFSGDGFAVATTIGSTAYNLSLGGSIVYRGFETLQLTPIAGISTSAYRSLLNSIVLPGNTEIKLVPREDSRNLLISVDGEDFFYENVDSIQTKIGNKSIKCLRKSKYSYPEIIRDKFLK